MSQNPSDTPGPYGSSNAKIIAVMGPTGSGKSSFLNAITAGNLKVGETLSSETSIVQPLEFTYKGQDMLLVDTPGFDDTNRTDTEILEIIATWLELTYNNNVKLTGLIYLHRITDNRVGGISAKNLRLFRKLVGDRVMKNVVLCTTMWDLDQGKGPAREEELCRTFWKEMVSSGASIARHNGQPQSAHAVLDRFLPLESIDLQIQVELKSGKKLIETAAGSEISDKLAEAQKKHEEELTAIREEIKRVERAKDMRTAQMIREDEAKVAARLERMETDRRRLEEDRHGRLEGMQAEVDRAQNSASASGNFRAFWQVVAGVSLAIAFASVGVPYPGY